METKKTLTECKDEVAKKYGFDSFNQLIKAYIINLDYVVLNSRIDEAAELYASQTKQSDLEKYWKHRCKLAENVIEKSEAYDDYLAFLAGKQIPETDIRDDKAAVIQKQSSPVSLEVEEAAKDYASDYSNPHNHKKDLKFSESDIFYIRQSTFKDAIKWQSQLRKRVIDPVEFAKKSFYEFLEWHKQQGFISIKPGDFEEYLTHKTKDNE